MLLTEKYYLERLMLLERKSACLAFFVFPTIISHSVTHNTEAIVEANVKMEGVVCVGSRAAFKIYREAAKIIENNTIYTV